MDTELIEVEMDENIFNDFLNLLDNPQKENFKYRVVTKLEYDGAWTFIPFEDLQCGDIFILFDEFPNQPVFSGLIDNESPMMLAEGNSFPIKGKIPDNYGIKGFPFEKHYLHPTLPY